MPGARSAHAQPVGFVDHEGPDSRTRSPAKALSRSHSLGAIGLGITNGQGERTMVPDAASTMPRVSRAAVRCVPLARASLKSRRECTNTHLPPRSRRRGGSETRAVCGWSYEGGMHTACAPMRVCTLSGLSSRCAGELGDCTAPAQRAGGLACAAFPAPGSTTAVTAAATRARSRLTGRCVRATHRVIAT